MSREQNPDTDFEQRLLAQLRVVVAERGMAEAGSGVGGASAVAPVRWRPNLRLALAGAAMLAVVVVVILALGSGPAAPPAAAEVLRQTAAVAAAAPGTSPVPGPGEFLYKKTKSLELQEWVPGGYTASFGGVVSVKGEFGRPFKASISWQAEAWMGRGQPSRNRQVMGTPRFLSSAEARRWRKAGSPLPSPFGGSVEKAGFPDARVIELRRGVVDVETTSGHGFRDFSKLPREPKALRLAIERRQGSGSPLDTGRVIAELWDILDKPNGTPALRAAVFGALAELPGIELDPDAKDLVGRSGSAISYESPSSGGEQQPGIRVDYIFDPETSELLGRREVITDPKRVPGAEGLAAGTVRREVAYLQSAIVDSTDQRPGEGDGGPVATTDPRQGESKVR